MRMFILSGLLVASLGSALPAQACDYAAQFVRGAPELGTVVPLNGQAFALAPFMGRTPMHAELYDPRAFAPIPVDVVSLGEDVVQLQLPPLEASIQYTARIWMDIVDDEYFDFAFVAAPEEDQGPPPAHEHSWQPRQGPGNSCENPGWYLDVQVANNQATDAVLFEVLELLPNDGIEVVGAHLVGESTPEDLRFSVHVRGGILNDRCFGVVAVDQAGNRSYPPNFRCLTAVPLDGGIPRIDAGTGTLDAGMSTPDAGTSTPDAGTSAPDAGTPDAESRSSGGLETADAGCGCTSGSKPDASVWLFGLLVVGLIRRRKS